MSQRYAELIAPKVPDVQVELDERPCNDIATEIFNRIKGGETS